MIEVSTLVMQVSSDVVRLWWRFNVRDGEVHCVVVAVHRICNGFNRVKLLRPVSED